MEQKQAKRSGMGFIGTLTLILIVLKAFGLIDVSWLWVLSPLWISALLVLLIFGTILVAGRLKKGRW
ncbi:MAG TPA: hypothetical protein IAC82_09460 [Candidatus Merdivicinus intestinigallinarum]|nr:hypothetical protein [Candidatus Merdivicinus intestinigallinarum]